MSVRKLHPKIQELKRRAAPIAYTSAVITRAASDSGETFEELLDKRIVRGYGNIWGVRNAHGERFHKGAWARSIRENGPNSGANYQIKFRDEHGRAMGLFDELKEDDIGLYFRTKPLDPVQWADDFLVQVRSGSINNFSNGFRYVFNGNAMMWNETDETIEIYEGILKEISGTAIPSDEETFVVRSMEEIDNLFDDTEDFIKTLPFKSQLECRKIIARHKSLMDQEALLQQRNEAARQTDNEPVAAGLDYSYLLNNLKLV